MCASVETPSVPGAPSYRGVRVLPCCYPLLRRSRNDNSFLLCFCMASSIDAATRGPARDDDILWMRTATRKGHVDWVHDLALRSASSESPTAETSDNALPEWRRSAADAVAAKHASSGCVRIASDSTPVVVPVSHDGPPTRLQLLSLISSLQEQLTISCACPPTQ